MLAKIENHLPTIALCKATGNSKHLITVTKFFRNKMVGLLNKTTPTLNHGLTAQLSIDVYSKILSSKLQALNMNQICQNPCGFIVEKQNTVVMSRKCHYLTMIKLFARCCESRLS